MTAGLLPWQQQSWDRLEAQIVAGKPPHALLVSGPVDAGKSRFVEALAARWLCRKPGSPCGECSQCLLLAAGTHPDLYRLQPEDSAQIKVDQVRDLAEWASQTAQQGGNKIAVINPADRMNQQAANALLKTLEEPPAGTLLCLVTDQPARLLPTLRSRCQHIGCEVPARDAAIAWLQAELGTRDDLELLLDIAGGVPLRVLNLIDDDYLTLRRQLGDALAALATGAGSPLRVAADLGKADPLLVLDILYDLVADSLQFSATGGQVMKQSDLSDALAAYSRAVPAAGRHAFLDTIIEAKRGLSSTANPNVQMQLEWVFMSVAPSPGVAGGG